MNRLFVDSYKSWTVHVRSESLKNARQKKMKIDGFPDVKIKSAKAAIDRNRDWALRRAEELVKQHPAGA